MAPEELQTAIEVFPSAPSISAYGGAMAAAVTVTNPRSQDVWVELARDDGIPVSQTFGVVYDAGDANRPVRGRSIGTTDSRFALRSGERRRYVWDETASPGTLGIRGLFNRDSSARLVVQVK